jgi:hypothetical protein
MSVRKDAFLSGAALLAAVLVVLPACASAPPPDAVYVSEAPPALPSETVVVSPGPDFVWVPGWWNWDRQYVWVAGSWQNPPRARAVWVAPSWRRTSRGWYRVNGFWK